MAACEAAAKALIYNALALSNSTEHYEGCFKNVPISPPKIFVVRSATNPDKISWCKNLAKQLYKPTFGLGYSIRLENGAAVRYSCAEPW